MVFVAMGQAQSLGDTHPLPVAPWHGWLARILRRKLFIEAQASISVLCHYVSSLEKQDTEPDIVTLGRLTRTLKVPSASFFDQQLHYRS